jgi:hypothetical protein
VRGGAPRSRKADQRRVPVTPNSGKLVAEGTPTKPIKLTSDGSERWGSIHVVAPGTARFAYATFENGGGERFDNGATLVAVGDAAPPIADQVIFVDNVTIEKSRGTGVWLQQRSTFIAGSKDLAVTESGDDEGPYPLVFKEIAGHGVTQGFDGALVNFRPTNTFEGVTGCIQTMPRHPSTHCPDPQPICDGM